MTTTCLQLLMMLSVQFKVDHYPTVARLFSNEQTLKKTSAAYKTLDSIIRCWGNLFAASLASSVSSASTKLLRSCIGEEQLSPLSSICLRPETLTTVQDWLEKSWKIFSSARNTEEPMQQGPSASLPHTMRESSHTSTSCTNVPTLSHAVDVMSQDWILGKEEVTLDEIGHLINSRTMTGGISSNIYLEDQDKYFSVTREFQIPRLLTKFIINVVLRKMNHYLKHKLCSF
ncbi:uncharacterized protein LOC142321384 [Lycorma delicatula]|uniref:uncharacterized protein LOC142321384 n=1 Tax=Lycorma delicatula TaxID=130591 RepID=UPI003F51709A